MSNILESDQQIVGKGTFPRQKKTSVSLRRIQPRTALVEQVVEQLRNGILDGKFALASELPAEGALAKTMGVSYTVIREAMRTLRSQGLVEISQGRRPRVKPAGPDAVRETLDVMLRRSSTSIRDLTELRRPLECETAALAAKRATSTDIIELAAIIEQQAKGETLDAQIESDLQFHVLLARAARNVLFELVMSSIWELLYESRCRTISSVGSNHAVMGHRFVLEAVRNHDPAKAREAMLQHMDMIIVDAGENTDILHASH